MVGEAVLSVKVQSKRDRDQSCQVLLLRFHLVSAAESFKASVGSKITLTFVPCVFNPPSYSRAIYTQSGYLRASSELFNTSAGLPSQSI